MPSDNIHKNHRERMREKYRKYGPDVFETHQLLEMLLFHSMRQGDTNPAAHNLLQISPYGSFGGADDKKLCEAEGIGAVSANLLQISSDTSVRILCDKLRAAPMDSEFCRRMFMWLWFRNKGPSTVGVLLLDSKNRYIDCTVIAKGRTVRPENYLDVIMSLMEKTEAAKFVIAHNHENGVAAPSVDDIYITEYLKKNLLKEGYTLLAHYIVTNADCVECGGY